MSQTSALVILAAFIVAFGAYFLAAPALDPAEQHTATPVERGNTAERLAETPRPTVDTGKSVRIGGTIIKVDIADTTEKRQRGLSGREGLAADEGMLFVFPESGLHGFWMKDMLFAIDILWLNSEGVVVHIEENVSPDTYPASFQSEKPAQFVLELSAGSAERLGVDVGDIAALPS